ncbi:imidazole glycerol phosphate synthase subunit HisH [Leptolyngbya sp. 7M]|uniref:imidazole glycerol phosphate synthase subunit HisH n=1 Tax=Leptolyngbya sp. 7M TaxID=2812896 RepID=UPI001B8CCA55|nr:imidazole glycerol phosphate synthase subunit HisH [Leptolyngbya sp. 7M]QYO65326.1 imidazole glycerol phosphate synthase subunit HisH [Leptolyngbya sp. 7M]
MKVAIVKYNAGNVASVANALKRLGIEPQITDDANTIKTADKVIFPGVGEASSAMNHLQKRGLDSVIKNLKQPLLAICLGMQLMAKFSDENDTKCLGILPYRVRRFFGKELKVPHIGWNTIEGLGSDLFKNIPEGARVYFVHSYFLDNGDHTVAQTPYGSQFSAAVNKDNFYGVQFHPEKSGTVGARILENFLNI